MSLADDAKILLIPSGYKTDTPFGKLYSVFPTNGNQDFRIDRATTGTRINPGGLIETMLADTPRLDHYGGNCPSVLRESPRTNRLTRSEEFDNATWVKVSSSVTANQIIAPDGQLTADKLFDNTANNRHFVYQNGAGTSGLVYTFSCYMKKGSLTEGTLSFNSALAQHVVFDLENGTVISQGGNIDSSEIVPLSNDWYRCSFTHTATASNLLYRVGTYNGGITYTGTGTDYIYIWGAQLEQGIGATSYIKTTTASVTRNLDNINCENETYDVGNDVTWFIDFDSYSYENSFRPLILIRNSGFTQTMDLITYKSGSDYYFRARATNQSSLQTIIEFGQNAIQMFERVKVAIRLYGSNFEIYVNGVKEYTGTSTNGDWTILNNSAILNDFGSQNQAPSMKLYDFRVYDKTMTQSELETLTTL